MKVIREVAWTALSLLLLPVFIVAAIAIMTFVRVTTGESFRHQLDTYGFMDGDISP